MMGSVARVARSIAGWIELAYRASAPLTLLAISVAVMNSTLPVLVSWGVAKIVSAAATGADLAYPIAMAIVLLTASVALSRISPLVSEALRDVVQKQVRIELIDRVAGFRHIAHFEDRRSEDAIRLLDRDAYRLGGIHHLIGAVGAGVSAGVVGAMFASVAWWLVVLGPLAMLPAVAAAVADFQESKIWLGNEEARRTGDRAAEVVRDPRSGLEVRAYSPYSLMWRVVSRGRDRQAILMSRSRIRLAWVELAGTAVLVGVLGLAANLVIASVQDTESKIAQLSLILMLVPQLLVTARALAASITAIVDGSNTFARLLWLRDLGEPGQQAPSAQPPDSIRSELRLTDVSFTYPGSDRQALSGVSLTIPRGSIVCLVGENGSGKSTLVNILAGLHAPSSGSIELDGVRFDTWDAAAWQARVTAAFQDFARFEFPLADAISSGDQDASTFRVQAALEEALAGDLARALPDGVRSQLGGRFPGGVELSGGQWQRVALARAFYKQSWLLSVLDEPTSALDPEAEAALYANYRDAALAAARDRGSITLFVSHRLSTALLADFVVVLEDGEVTAVGPHEQLLQTTPAYSSVFTAQAERYSETN